MEVMDSQAICCFCGEQVPMKWAVQIVVYPNEDRVESQVLYCHRRCLRERLLGTIPTHPDLDEPEPGSS